ncbi:2'-5' RNA ligase family protein [Celerinatantimonas sp. MCCC 1A17872]|uniref:2'-5' RNA ligase family protein n=1 Tax=Celerinatantimonas sp. MCCC 1A17872 TaxID=3177514 RepID=UPI0038C6F13F
MRWTKLLALTSALSASLFMPLTWAKNVSVDIFALPSESIQNLVKENSQTLSHLGMTTFYAKGKQPHITLYLTEYPEQALPKVKKVVHQLANQTAVFNLSAQGISVTKGNWVFIDISWSKQLQNLADKTTLALEDYRAKTPNLPDWVKNYPNKLAAFNRYGSPNVFQNFQPHMTLLANEQNASLETFKRQVAKQLPHAQGKVSGIGIAIVDPLGQPTKIIATYPLRH